MANCNVTIYDGPGAVAAARAFIITLDDTKLLEVTMCAPADSPIVMVVYKT